MKHNPLKAHKAMYYLTKLMSEHIRMPGYPQLIVTRLWAYNELRALGWTEPGWAGAECVFLKRALPDALTDESVRDAWWRPVRETFRKQAT